MPKPGLLALHGNRTEDLASLLAEVLRAHPLGPLEEEVILVQSNGMAEWLKMTLAQQLGICSATRVELPARFLWRTYRQVLGERAVPREAPLDKLPLTWRLVRVLPDLLGQAVFAPLARYLSKSVSNDSVARAPGDSARVSERLLQLCTQLADLFDQYQNYRSDWLEDWAAGRAQLRNALGGLTPIPASQLWQPALWQALVESLQPEQRGSHRAHLQSQVVQALQRGPAGNVDDVEGGRGRFAKSLPRRVVVFGIHNLPASTLELLMALGRYTQVMLFVPNPSQGFWVDVGLEEQPLLAAWGRQNADFIRHLIHLEPSLPRQDAFHLDVDTRSGPADVNGTAPTAPLLKQLQLQMRDLHQQAMPLAVDDRSLIFHSAHSAVRELEVLHDHLLALLADPKAALSPKDIVVMVPDVKSLTPAIQALFGQYPRHDKRFIPFSISDLSAEAQSPLVKALMSLLNWPSQRLGLSELLDWLQVPAIARRFGIHSAQLPLLSEWMKGAGIRWGLDAQQRQQLGLPDCGEQNTAWFGLQRLLMGYAVGDTSNLVSGVSGVFETEPYTEVSGLDAELVGGLSRFVQALSDWRDETIRPASPQVWRERGMAMMRGFFKAQDEAETQTLTALEEALNAWYSACELAELQSPLPLAALRMAWMSALQTPRLGQPFQAGGVTFCTLMPMRAIPFEVVCLLGMNEGEFPRRDNRLGFDLMGEAGQFRPGDRSRQQDDRQLMLDALLSARRQLLLSWTGRNVRDNTPQPPSVLVAQLRDQVAALWGQEALQSRTTEHPLQPFSRHYFSGPIPLVTYAKEWHPMHVPMNGEIKGRAAWPDVQKTVYFQGPLSIKLLTDFYKNPARAFFKNRLNVSFWHPNDLPPDHELFELDALAQYQIIQKLTETWKIEAQVSAEPLLELERQIQRLRRSGELPLKSLGDVTERELIQTLTPMAEAWQGLQAELGPESKPLHLRFEHEGVVLEDTVTLSGQGLRGEGVLIQLEPGRLLDKAKGKLKLHKLLTTWLTLMLLAEQGLGARLLGQDALLELPPIPPEKAQQHLPILLAFWQRGLHAPLPLPLKTALASLQSKDKKTHASDVLKSYEGGHDEFSERSAEAADMAWARVYPAWDDLNETDFAALAEQVYTPLMEWAANAKVQPLA